MSKKILLPLSYSFDKLPLGSCYFRNIVEFFCETTFTSPLTSFPYYVYAFVAMGKLSNFAALQDDLPCLLYDGYTLSDR